MNRVPKVEIVILNYNRWRETLDCVNSIQQCTYSNYEILIVDNASTDESYSKINDSLPGTSIISTKKNLGYTGGVNVGIREAIKKQPDYILLLNEDTFVTPTFLTHLVEAMEENTSAAAACGTIFHYPETSKVWYAGGRLIPWRGLAIHNNNLLISQNTNHAQCVTFLTGCMMLLRTALIEKIGMKDERFFMSLEDIEYSSRIIKKGYNLLYVPSAIIYHRIPIKYKSKFNLYYSIRNRLLLINTSIPARYKFIAKTYFFLVISIKLIVWFILNPEYFKIAKMGLEDYFRKNFYEGRGLTGLTSN